MVNKKNFKKKRSDSGKFYTREAVAAQIFSHKEQKITYTLKEEESNLVASVLNLAEMTADNQINEEDRADARELIGRVAELLGIPYQGLEFEEDVNDDGDIVVTIRRDEPKPQKPKLTLVSNVDTNDNEPND